MTVSSISDPSCGKLTAKKAEQLFKSVIASEPVLKEAELDDFAGLPANVEHFVRKWRCMAVLATKDGAFYQELSDDPSKAETFAPTVNMLHEFADLLREAAKMADCVSTRVMVAGCGHKDFVQWMEADISA